MFYLEEHNSQRILSSDIYSKGMDRSQGYLFTKTRKNRLLHSKSLLAISLTLFFLKTMERLTYGMW